MIYYCIYISIIRGIAMLDSNPHELLTQTLITHAETEAETDAVLGFVPSNPESLRHAVTQMAAFMNVADWRFLKLISAMDREQSWREGGYCNLSNWLDHQCGIGPCAARERIRVARALEYLPLIDKAFMDCIISYSKVRAITRVANPETDEMLLQMAECSSASEIERLVRTYERTSTCGRTQSTDEKRSLEWHYEDGMLVISARVPAEQGAMVVKALQKVVDLKEEERARYWQDLWEGISKDRHAKEHVSADASIDVSADVSAEALVDESAEALIDVPAEALIDESAEALIDESAEAPEDEEGNVIDEPVTTESADGCQLPAGLLFEMSSREQKLADAMVEVAEHYLATCQRGSKRLNSGHRYEVVLHIDRNKLAQASATDESARYYVDPDWGIDEAAARQICCDADVTEMIMGETGNILNFEHRRRIVPARLRRVLEIRDVHCRFPGCVHKKYLEAHHVKHWIDGGETNPENLVMLCSAHHALLHRNQFQMQVWDDEVVFISTDGELIGDTIYPQFQDVSAEFNHQSARLLPPNSPVVKNNSIESHRSGSVPTTSWSGCFIHARTGERSGLIVNGIVLWVSSEIVKISPTSRDGSLGIPKPCDL